MNEIYFSESNWKLNEENKDNLVIMFKVGGEEKASSFDPNKPAVPGHLYNTILMAVSVKLPKN